MNTCNFSAWVCDCMQINATEMFTAPPPSQRYWLGWAWLPCAMAAYNPMQGKLFVVNAFTSFCKKYCIINVFWSFLQERLVFWMFLTSFCKKCLCSQWFFLLPNRFAAGNAFKSFPENSYNWYYWHSQWLLLFLQSKCVFIMFFASFV